MPDDLRDGLGRRRRVIVGIRPEHFEDADARRRRASTSGVVFTTRVDLVESMGSEIYAHFDLDAGGIESDQLRELAEDAGLGELPATRTRSERGIARLSPDAERHRRTRHRAVACTPTEAALLRPRGRPLAARAGGAGHRAGGGDAASPGALALDRARGEAGDDAPLEDQHEDDQRHRHDDRRGADRPERDLELLAAGEEGDRRGHRPPVRRAGQRDREEELVPGEDEDQQPGGHDARGAERHHDLAERLEARRPVDQRRLLELARDVAEERGEDVDGQRQAEGRARAGSGRGRCCRGRCRSRSSNSGAAIAIGGKVEIESRIARIRNLKREVQAGERVAGEGADQQRRGSVTLPATIALLRSALVKSPFFEDRGVVVERRVRREQVGAREVGAGLQRGVDQPVEREQAEERSHDADHSSRARSGRRSRRAPSIGRRVARLRLRSCSSVSARMLPPMKRM